MRRTARRVRRTFTIEMGQAFRDDLPNEVRRLGGYVHSTRLDESSTVVLVTCSFSGRTARWLQEELWKVWPACSVGVREGAR